MFVPGKTFQPSLTCEGEVGDYLSKAPLRCYTLGLAPDLTLKLKTRLKRPPRDTYSSLLRTFVKYGGKFFITLGPGRNVIKLFCP